MITEGGTLYCSEKTLLQYFAFQHEPHEDCTVIELGPPHWGLSKQGSSYVDYCESYSRHDVWECACLEAQSRNLPDGCEQDQFNVRHDSSSLLWYSTPGLPRMKPKWGQPTPRFCITKIRVHKNCSCVYALLQEECRQRSTHSSPLYLLDLGDRFTLVPTYKDLQERDSGCPTTDRSATIP